MHHYCQNQHKQDIEYKTKPSDDDDDDAEHDTIMMRANYKPVRENKRTREQEKQKRDLL